MSADEGAVTLPPLLPWQAAGMMQLLATREALPHGLLLAGRAGHGNSTFALHLARALLCEAPRPDGAACGACPSCHFCALGHHPDLRVVVPLEEPDKDGQNRRAEWITIAQVRETIAFVQLTSHRQRAKVVVVDPAERLNAEAANALLKTLEEPPPGTWLLLVSSRPARLPATIRSRCRRVACPAADLAHAVGWLESEGVAGAALIAAQAGGAPLRALGLADDALQAERRLWLGALAQPSTLSPLALGARIDAVPKAARRTRLGLLLGWLAAWAADLAAVSWQAPPRYCPDFAGELETLAARTSRLATTRFFREVLQETALVSHPLAPRLVVERLLLRYRAILH